MGVFNFGDYVSTLVLAPVRTRVTADHHSLIPHRPQLVRSPTTVATETNFKNAECLTEILVFTKKATRGITQLSEFYPGKNHEITSLLDILKLKWLLRGRLKGLCNSSLLCLDGYQMCSSHASAEETELVC